VDAEQGSSHLDIRRIATIHAEASAHREELLEDARQLLAQGRIREAKRLMKMAEKLHLQLAALERQMNPPVSSG
jgi:hypothetical protein